MPSRETIKKYLDDGTGLFLIAVLLAAAMAENLLAVSYLMDNELSKDVQFVVAATCVLLEAFGFVKARQCWRSGRWGACALMSVATLLAICNSVSNEATFYNINFANKAQTLESKIDVSHDTAKEKAEIEKRLADAGSLRPTGAIEADITLALAKTAKGDRYDRSLDRMTKGCTNTRAGHYDECGKVLELRKELETSAALGPQVTKDRERLDAIRASQAWVTTIGVTRPGAAIIADVVNGVRSYVWNVPEDRYISVASVQTAIILLVMTALQFFNIALPFAWFGNTQKDSSKGARVGSRPPRILVDNDARNAVDDDPGNANDNRFRHLWISGQPIRWQSEIAIWAKNVMSPSHVNVADDFDAPSSLTLPADATNDATVDVINDNVDGIRDDVDVPVGCVDVMTQALSNTDATHGRESPRTTKAQDFDLGDPKVAAIAAFRKRRCTHVGGSVQRSADVYAAYAAETPMALRFGQAHFTRVFRNLPGFPTLDHYRVDARHWHIMGIRLTGTCSFATAS